MNNNEQWYIARTKRSKESVLAAYLGSLDVQTYYPIIRRLDTPNARKLEPLFPGYLFVRLTVGGPQWPRIRWAVGLSYFLSSGDRPAPMPGELIEYLKERTREWNTLAPEIPFDAGSRVFITSGPFAGLSGIFQQYTPSGQRCKILLETVNGLMGVEMETSHLRSAVPAHIQL